MSLTVPYLEVTRPVGRPGRELAVLLRLHPEQLWQRAFATTPGHPGRVVVPLFSLGRLRLGRVVVSFEFSSVSQDAPSGAVLHLRWCQEEEHRLLPVGEGDLVVTPLLPGEESQLGLTAGYRPPGGPLGEVLDRLVGRRLARRVARSFLDHIAGAAELWPATTEGGE